MIPGAQFRRFHPLVEDVRARLDINHVFLAVIVAVWVGLYLKGLGELPIQVWDESRYATPARHMVESGDWLDPKIRVKTHAEGLDLGPRLTKPPLVYWLQAAAMSVLGVTEFAARLPTAIAALCCAGLVYHLGHRTYDRRAGFAGALILLAFPGLLLGSHGGRAAVSDTTLALFGSAFVWLTWWGRERPWLLVPAGAFAGLAVMTKGIAAGVFVVILGPVVLYYYRSYLTGWTALAVVTTVIVALPWHLYAWITHGDAFIQQYFLQSVTSRITGELSNTGVEPIFSFMNYPYIRYAVRVFAPPYPYALPVFGLGLVFALLILIRLVGRDGVSKHREKLFLVWWAAAVPLTFVVGGGNHAWYLLPMYIPGATLLGYVPAAIANGELGAGVRERIALLTDEEGRFSDVGRRLSSSRKTAVYVAICVGVVLVLVALYGAPLAETYNEEQRDIGMRIAMEIPADETIHVSREGVPRRALMSVSFYADRTLERTRPNRLATDSEIAYAILPIGAEYQIDRPHKVIEKGPENGIVVVAFQDT